VESKAHDDAIMQKMNRPDYVVSIARAKVKPITAACDVVILAHPSGTPSRMCKDANKRKDKRGET
jgi:hypothetical protein